MISQIHVSQKNIWQKLNLLESILIAGQIDSLTVASATTPDPQGQIPEGYIVLLFSPQGSAQDRKALGV